MIAVFNETSQNNSKIPVISVLRNGFDILPHALNMSISLFSPLQERGGGATQAGGGGEGATEAGGGAAAT